MILGFFPAALYGAADEAGFLSISGKGPLVETGDGVTHLSRSSRHCFCGAKQATAQTLISMPA